jgi:hypothetical protein
MKNVNFDLMKNVNFDLMKFDLLIIPLNKYCGSHKKVDWIFVTGDAEIFG